MPFIENLDDRISLQYKIDNRTSGVLWHVQHHIMKWDEKHEKEIKSYKKIWGTKYFRKIQH